MLGSSPDALALAEQKQVCPDLVPVGRGKLIDVLEEDGPRLAALALAGQRHRSLHAGASPGRPPRWGPRPASGPQGVFRLSLTAEIVGQSARKLGTFGVLLDRLPEGRDGLVYSGPAASRSAFSRASTILDGITAAARLKTASKSDQFRLSLGERLLLPEPGLDQAHQERRLVGAGRQPLLELPGRLSGCVARRSRPSNCRSTNDLGSNPNAVR